MARPKADTVQITFRIPREWLSDLDTVAAEITESRRGLKATRTEAMRTLILDGLHGCGLRWSNGKKRR